MKKFFQIILITVFAFNIVSAAQAISLTDATETFENGCKATNGTDPSRRISRNAVKIRSDKKYDDLQIN